MKTAQQFLQNPDECPCCNSSNIAYKPFNFESTTLYRPCSCMKCEAAWDVAYDLGRCLLWTLTDGSEYHATYLPKTGTENAP